MKGIANQKGANGMGKRFICFLLVMFLSACFAMTGFASPVGEGKRILFVPLDNRPVTDKQTREVAEKLGYEILVPPEELLGSIDRTGNPDGLWAWLAEKGAGADAAVLSTDAMLYGSLVHSRNHDLPRGTVMERVQRFQELHEKFPRLPIYAFGTILRTLLSPNHSGQGMEPEEYQRNAMKIRDFSILRDKADMGLLPPERGKRELEKMKQEISPAVLESWEAHHLLNQSANEALIDLAREDVLTYLYLGADDSAPFSQTHYEGRLLKAYGKDLHKTRFQLTSGADELAMVMLCRAITDDMGDIPFVHTVYNEGKGRETVPAFCMDEIGNDVDGIIVAAGGMQVPSPARAEMVFAVNTSPDGRTMAANAPSNTTRPRNGTKYFVSLVKGLVEQGYPVAVGDISCANGSDNAMMEQLRQEDLQFRLRAYGGWNTATNSMGFLIGTGILAKWMDRQAADELMLTRYLDDWAYQANVRQQLAALLYARPGCNPNKLTPDDRQFATEQGTRMMSEFAAKNLRLPRGLSLKDLRISQPWNRMFECDVFF